MTTVSKHAEDRIRKRVGLKKKSVRKTAELALKYGVRHGDTSGKLRSYIDGVYLSRRKANDIRIYHHQVYIFYNRVLITVWPLPQQFCQAADAIAKKIKKLSDEGAGSEEQLKAVNQDGASGSKKQLKAVDQDGAAGKEKQLKAVNPNEVSDSAVKKEN